MPGQHGQRRRHPEILIRPDLAEGEGVLALSVIEARAAELIQAAVSIQVGKGPLYRRVARGIGLTGPMPAPEPGPPSWP
jgi:hypothetical protein